ncbi:hypothetical protein CDL15_Pgr020437 [Punica granatum]|uniref:Uncharacterized protein n=1 Tax=Punica granatum TaxID=22663 RepID=A0A218VWM5_PUNGR|nr:hypothetical protein CDL15_Pgr020437 [Punica granatum]PKI75573.1 hypothetical protein CRG98_003974 [Punica granatum]
MENIRLLPLRVQETVLLPIKRSDIDGVAIRIRPDEFVFLACCIIEMLILQLPMDVIDGSPVPRVIFTGRPHTFHAFLICLMLSCYGAVCSIYLHHIKPKVARCYGAISVAAMGAASLVFLWASAWACFHWATSALFIGP